MSNPNVQARGEKAQEKARKVQKKLDLVSYVLEADDIIFTSGPKVNRSVRDLWEQGPLERDYIIKNLWFRNDDQVNHILNDLCCK